MAHETTSDLVIIGVSCKQTQLSASFFVTRVREAAVDVRAAGTQLLDCCETVRVPKRIGTAKAVAVIKANRIGLACFD